MYVTTYPCLQCARYIVDASIHKVVYVEAYPVKESADYLMRNRVKVEPFSGFKARAFNIVFKPVS
jgi:deoxycytidylate deaminase